MTILTIRPSISVTQSINMKVTKRCLLVAPFSRRAQWWPLIVMGLFSLILYWGQFRTFLGLNAPTLSELANLANLLIVGLIFVEAWPFLGIHGSISVRDN